MPSAAVLRRLRVEAARDLEGVDRLLADLVGRVPDVATERDPVVLAYVAITLHQIYTAAESAFERICREFEVDLPRGADAHQALLRDMTLAIPRTRPEVLRETTAEGLRPLLRFRHFVRHAYVVTWDACRLAEVVAMAATAIPELRKDMDRFLAFLDEASAEAADR